MKTKLITREINPKECRYLNMDYRINLPVLVLAIKYPHRFKKTRRWLKIAHQTAGHGCHQHYFFGTILKPRKQTLDKIKEINDSWLETDAGCLSYPSLDDLLKYRNQLKTLLGVDCNYSYADFEEAIYPVDCTEENLTKLTSEKLPKNLDNLISWNNKIEKLLGCFGRWNLYILGENCD